MVTDTGFRSIQLYGNYDRAVVDQLVHVLTYPPGSVNKPILHVWATPERALGNLSRKLRVSAGGDQNVYPLVFASINRVAPAEFDITRASLAPLRRFAYDGTGTQLDVTWYSTIWPLPMNITYEVNLWCRNLYDLNDLIVQCQLLFDHGQIKYISVEHVPYIGTRLVCCELLELRQLPMISDEEKQRQVRGVLTFVVRGWIIRAAQVSSIIETVITDLYDSDDMETEGDLLGRVTVTAD